MTIKEYLDKIEEIYQEQPDYERGHDGSDGKCDCIGMLKCAIRRNGLPPSGLKGTNYAARKTIKDFQEIQSAKELSIGQVVIKAIEPGEEGYDLPDEYKPGGVNYNGDLRDYSHIGTVTGTNPLEITHMTSPKPKKDTKLGRWRFSGWLPQIDGISPAPDPDPEPEPKPERSKATVWAPTGETVNIRKGPSTSKALVERVPIGSVVDIMEYEPDWCQVAYTDRRGATWRGWMMTDFLIFDQAEDEPMDPGDGYPEDPGEDIQPGDFITIRIAEDDAVHFLTLTDSIKEQVESQIGRG